MGNQVNFREKYSPRERQARAWQRKLSEAEGAIKYLTGLVEYQTGKGLSTEVITATRKNLLKAERKLATMQLEDVEAEIATLRFKLEPWQRGIWQPVFESDFQVLNQQIARIAELEAEQAHLTEVLK